MKSTLRLTLQPYINHNVNEPYPFVCIRYGNEVVYNGALTTKKTFKYVIDCDSNLVIEHYNKQPSDTTVNENNEIVADKAIELKSIMLDDYSIPLTFLYDCEYHTEWNNKFEIITNTLYFGFNGKYKIPILANISRYKYYVMWQEEKSLNSKNQQQHVNDLGEIVETFTRF